MDRLEAMTAFVAVAELRAFAAAARRLGVSPSAVTRSVAALEDHVGIRLMHRTTRSVTLTDAGTRYLERAQRILLDVAEAEDAAQAERSVPTGRFVVSAPVVFGRMHVAPVLCEYLARQPALTGELMLADRMVSLVDEGIDLAVRIGNLDDAGLIARKVGETRRVLVAAPAYFARRKRPRTAADLAKHELLQCTALSPSKEWSLHGPRGVVRVGFTPRFVTNSVDAAIGHALLGFGVTMALAYQVERAVREGKLEVVLPKLEPPALPIQLVYATKRNLSANIRVFIETVEHQCNWRFVKL